MMSVLRWVRAASAVSALTILAAMAGAQSDDSIARDLSLMQGRGQLLRFANEVTRVAVAEPKIADAVVVSPREVMINAKAMGHTTVVIWENGVAPARYEVTVEEDGSQWEIFRKKVKESVPDGSVDVTGTGDTLVLTGTAKTPEDAKRAGSLAQTRAKNVINLIQVPPAPDPRQILLQVRFASVDRTGLSELGFNYFSRNDKMLGGVSTQQFNQPRFSQLQFQDQQFQNTTINFADLLNIFVFRPDLNIGATIKALQSRNLLQILAEPNLITLEGKRASFIAGGSFPVPIIAATSTGGAVAPVVTVQFKPFGVQLEFTPEVTASGGIHLKVAPEVSSLDYANAVTLQGFLIPAITQRRAETEVILKDGESFAIAGLIDNRVIEQAAKFPWLGDVPILGNLFRSRATRKTTDELLVVITPRFVKPLAPGQEVKLPDLAESWLPSVAEQKGEKAKPKEPKPEFVGPRGHQAPK